MTRLRFLGQFLRNDTGRVFHGAALRDVQRRQVISRAEYLAYERRVRARLFQRRVLVACAFAMVACIAASKLLEIWRRL